MSIRSSRWPAGFPCWADLQTPDVAAAEAFYGPVLGWDFLNDDNNEFGGYAVAQRDSVAAVGLGPLQAAGLPSMWTMYFASDDAGQTTAAITEHGGSVLMPVDDVGELGRLCIAADPTGAVFGVWEAGTHIGAGITGEPGGIAWEDLRTPDPDAARAFYSAVFGFEYQPLEMAGPSYQTFHQPGDQAPMGGIGDMMGMADAAPHWLLYFGVADAAAASEAIKAGGGTVIQEGFETPYGTMVGALDPAGALFWVVQVNPDQPNPDRSG